MTTDLCFKCSNEDSVLCTICGIAKDGAREHFKPKPITNYDQVISKTPEELAEWIADDLIEPGYNSREQTVKMWLDWLKQEVTTNSTT